MRSLFISFLFLLFFSCNNQNEANDAPASENDVDAARNFINAVLKQDFNKARVFLLNDSVNDQSLDVTERLFRERLTAEDKRAYAEASINIHEVKSINDSVTVVYYSNSYKKEKDSLKVVQENDQWLVDLKYSFPAAGVEAANAQKDTSGGK